MTKITFEQIREVAREYFQEELNKALELVIDLPTDPCINIDEEITGAQDGIKKLQQTLRTGRYNQYCISDALSLWEQLSPDEPKKKDTDQFEYLCRLMTKAAILRRRYFVAELSGLDYDGHRNDPIFHGILPTQIPPHPKSEGDENNKAFGLLSHAIEAYLKLKKPIWVHRTVGDNLRSLNLLVSVIGNDKKMIDVNKDDITNVRNTLINLPKGVLLADTRLDKKYINPIHDTKIDEKLSYTTQDKYFTMIRSFLKWAVDEELIPEMPGRNVKLIKNPKSDSRDKRDPYSIAQLEKIFSSPLYTGSKSPSRRAEAGNFKTQDAYYWIPLVALFSGMRLGEIVQLNTNDLKFENDVWFFDIAPDEAGEKIIKTTSSIRKVPVHHQLIKLGLIEYYLQKRAAKKPRIFHEIKRSASGGYSDSFSKWWSRYMTSTNIRTVKTTFHSFRHTFVDALREANVHEDVRRSLTGHIAGNSNDAHSNYGHGTSLKRLKTEINKLEYPFLQTHLENMLHDPHLYQ